MKGEKVPVYGNGLNSRDWLHVSDHCQAIHLVLTKGTPGEIYNIGGGRELTNIELTKLIISKLNKGEDWRGAPCEVYYENYNKFSNLIDDYSAYRYLEKIKYANKLY